MEKEIKYIQASNGVMLQSIDEEWKVFEEGEKDESGNDERLTNAIGDYIYDLICKLENELINSVEEYDGFKITITPISE